ncbi:Y-family DNA polymerase [Arenicella xantha]|uniref:Protein ImuB n=1 Tax=Arenicella xantha TaxID=644221 RepID=A0A395JFT3_9GAMM|nr:DNA polymerase Y family protein [Arenicella xantha]RBP48620.1 protein ImuB [Arenicella xantha]
MPDTPSKTPRSPSFDRSEDRLENRELNTKTKEKPEEPPTLWLCLRLTHLALNSLDIALDTEQPAAITYQQQVWQCNTQAAKSGINPGMSVNHALMLNPTLHLQEREPDREANRLTQLSHWAYRFTSLVSRYNDHTLLLEIGKSVKLFNNLNHLLNLLNNDLASFKIAAQQGLANTAKAAYVSSFSQAQNQPSTSKLISHNLGNACIEHLDIDDKTIAQLHNCGLESLNDLNAIPNRELGARFGRKLLDYLEKLYGNLADPQIAITPPETFHASVDFAEPIHNLNWIQQQLNRLLQDLASFLALRQLVCRSFTWRFYQDNNRLLKTVTIGISSKDLISNQDKAVLLFEELTQLKLASLQLSWEFSSIELSSTQLVPVTLFNNDLFDPKPATQQFDQLIDKLSNRLGHNTLFRVSPEPEHLPELANGRRHASVQLVKESSPQYNTPQLHNNTLKDEPLWLLEQPKRLAQHANQPLLEGPLNIIHGPNRITSHWWAKLQSRDYFIARQPNGRLLWIFFERGGKNWYLHGLFA